MFIICNWYESGRWIMWVLKHWSALGFSCDHSAKNFPWGAGRLRPWGGGEGTSLSQLPCVAHASISIAYGRRHKANTLVNTCLTTRFMRFKVSMLFPFAKGILLAKYAFTKRRHVFWSNVRRIALHYIELHTYIHTYTHTYIHTCAQACIET